MKYLLLLSFFAISICCATNIYSQQHQYTYVEDLESAILLSQEHKTNIVLIFSASWCAHCNNLYNDIPKIEELRDKIICIIDNDTNKKLSKKFRIKSLPTSIVLDFKGNELSRIVGYNQNNYRKWLIENEETNKK